MLDAADSVRYGCFRFALLLAELEEVAQLAVERKKIIRDTNKEKRKEVHELTHSAAIPDLHPRRDRAANPTHGTPPHARRASRPASAYGMRASGGRPRRFF